MNRKSSSFFSRVLLLFVAGAVLAVGVGGMEWQKRRSAVAPAQPIVAIVGSTASATINEAAGQVDILVSFDLRNLGQAAARDVRVRLVTGKSGKAEGMRVAEEFTLANTLHSGTRLVPVLRLQTPTWTPIWRRRRGTMSTARAASPSSVERSRSRKSMTGSSRISAARRRPFWPICCVTPSRTWAPA